MRSLVFLHASALLFTACSGGGAGPQAPAALAGLGPAGGFERPAEPPATAAASGSDRESTAVPADSPVPAARPSRALLGRLPAESLLVLRLPHVESLGEAWRRTALAAELGPLLAAGGLDPSAWSGTLDGLGLDGRRLASLVALLPALRGELVVALTGILPPGDREGRAAPFTATVLFEAREGGAELRRALEELLEGGRRRSALAVARHREGWGFSLGDDTFAVELACKDELFSVELGSPFAMAGPRREPGPFPRPSSFLSAEVVRATPDLALAGGEVVLEVYLHLAPLWRLARRALPPEQLDLLRAGGLVGVEGASAAVALSERGLSEALAWCSPAGSDLLSRALTARPPDPRIARYAPAESTTVVLGALDLSSLVSGLLAMMPKETRSLVEAQIDDLRRFRGIDLRRDLFENLGPTLALVAGPGPGGWTGGALPLCAIAEMADPAGAEELIAGIASLAGARAGARTVSVAGSRGLAFEVARPELPGPLTVTVVPDGGALLVATDQGLLERCLEAARAPAPARPELAEVLRRGGARVWAVALTSAAQSPTPAAVVGRSGDSGLVLEAREGSGALAAGALAMGVALPAAVAIPFLLEARFEANEKAAIDVLRSIADAQRMVRERVLLDLDGDGRGEALLLGELSGQSALRGHARPIDPPVLSGRWREVDGGAASRSGYVFRIDLAAADGTGLSQSLSPSGLDISPDAAERGFVAYAWPLQSARYGRLAFALDAAGRLWSTENAAVGQRYEGFERQPRHDACRPQDPLRRSEGRYRGHDGGTWVTVE